MSAYLFFSSNFDICHDFLKQNWGLGQKPHQDIVFLNSIEESISIEMIRQLSEIVLYPPAQLPAKTIILTNFEQTSLPAQNAFLKTLEEHPAYIRFVLQASDPQKILETIKSRCQIQYLDQPNTVNTTALAENFLNLLETSTHAQLIEWCTQHKDKTEVLPFLKNLLNELHLHNSRKPTAKTTQVLSLISEAIGQIEQNFNVLLTLENCLFTIKSRF